MRQLWSYRVLIPVALFLGLAPYPFGAEPHLQEKLRMLATGTLVRPLDIFDLFWHAWPLALLAFKAGRGLGNLLQVGRRP
jgi:hypothetical protein